MEKTIFKDYSEKIAKKLSTDVVIKPSDINELIILLNYCFQQKNDFFIPNFNKKVIKHIYLLYNKLKTNILTNEIEDLFSGISKENIKLLRFIIINFVNNFETINNESNENLCVYVSKESMRRCIKYLSELLKD